MDRVNSFGFTALLIICFMLTVSLAIRYTQFFTDAVTLVSYAIGYVLVVSLKSLIAALLVWLFLRKSLGLLFLLNVLIFGNMVNQIIGDTIQALFR